MRLLQFTVPVVYGVATAIAAAGLVFDLSMGNAITSGTPYILLVLAGYWFPQKKAAYVLAGVATSLTLIDGLSTSPRLLGGGLINLILNISVFWLIAIFIRHMREVEAAAQTETQRASLLLNEVNHRVSNKLQFLLSFLRGEARRMRNEDARQALETVASRVLAIAAVQRLVAPMVTQDSTVRIDVFLRAIVDDLRRTVPDANIAICAEPINFAAADTVALGLIMNELIINAVKHAFGPGMDGSVTVRLSPRPTDGKYAFEVEDDGVGMNRDAEPGSPLVREMANMIGGEVVYEPARPDDAQRPGTRCRLVLPMPTTTVAEKISQSYKHLPLPLAKPLHTASESHKR